MTKLWRKLSPHQQAQVTRFARILGSSAVALLLSTYLKGDWKELPALIPPALEIAVRQVWPALPTPLSSPDPPQAKG